MGFLKDNFTKLIILVIIAIGFFIIIDYFTPNENFYKRMLMMRKQESYSGIIIEKYIDKAEHSTPMLRLTDTVISLENDFWDSITVGDSIVKIRGQAEINVYRKDTTKIIFDYDDYFKDIIKCLVLK